MKQSLFHLTLRLAALPFVVALSGCSEVLVVDRPYQRVLINSFATPLRTLLPGRVTNPSKLTIRVSGTISQPVALAVDYLNPGGAPVRRDTLAAGTYADKIFRGDFYSKEQVQLLVTGTPGTVGSLTIEWYAQ